uniref:Rho-GAP domain-containing protein n=1 Tax=Callorhinchus milii TaxID=7868 RepID=A0A4W3H1E2_CALMI
VLLKWTNPFSPVYRLQAANSRSQRQRKARPCSQYHQKLFNGDLEQFIQTSGQPIPLVAVSCIRFINLHGLHHEGIFRIPGSQMEVNDIRNAFEIGQCLPAPFSTVCNSTTPELQACLLSPHRGLWPAPHPPPG